MWLKLKACEQSYASIFSLSLANWQLAVALYFMDIHKSGFGRLI